MKNEVIDYSNQGAWFDPGPSGDVTLESRICDDDLGGPNEGCDEFEGDARAALDAQMPEVESAELESDEVIHFSHLMDHYCDEE